MIKTLAFILTVSLAACRGEAEVRYSGEATTPELVALDIDPTVMVVANADEPIFYWDNTYWLYRDDGWFRSRSHRTGFKRVDDPPERISRIDRPLAYVHFRPGTSAQRTTLNQRDQPAPQPDRPEPTQRTQPLDQPPADPMRDPIREPNPQGPSQPIPNPQPPQQVPPGPDRDPTLRGPSSTKPMPPDQVPPATPERDRPGHQIAPDPDRGPTSPSADDRPSEPDDAKHKDPAEAERNERKKKDPNKRTP